MTLFDHLPRTAIVMRPRLAKHTWGPDPTRTVSVAVLDTGDGLVARVFGAEADKAVVLDEEPLAELGRRELVLADGRTWTLVAPSGCLCKVPAPLKGIDARKVG